MGNALKPKTGARNWDVCRCVILLLSGVLTSAAGPLGPTGLCFLYGNSIVKGDLLNAAHRYFFEPNWGRRQNEGREYETLLCNAQKR